MMESFYQQRQGTIAESPMNNRPVTNHRRGSVRLLLAVLLPLVAGSAADVFAQGSWRDPLLHEFTPRRQWVGGEGGYGFWKSEAQFGVTDRELPCSWFTDGEGDGPAFGVRAFIYPFPNNDWVFGTARVRHESRKSTFITRLEDEPIQGELSDSVVLQHEAQVDAHMAAINLELMVGLDFFGTGLYIAGGISGGLLLDGTYDYTERILAPQELVYSATGTNEQQLRTGPKFEGYSAFTVDARGGAGYILRIGDRFGVGIEGLYSYPLTSLLKAPEEIKQQGVIGTLSILYNYGDPE